MPLSRSRASAKSQPTALSSLYSPMSASAFKYSVALAVAVLGALLVAQNVTEPRPSGSGPRLSETQSEADSKSTGCIGCHGQTDSPSMHTTGTVRIGCAECHGGNPTIQPPAGTKPGDPTYEQAKKQAHPQPRLAGMWRGSANPVRPATGWLKESKEYIQFVNPGDLRVAAQTCGSAGCHPREVLAVRTSMMTHGAMLWGAA